jgi:uncharacterized membrane-anchored protein
VRYPVGLALAKFLEIALIFWIINVVATTLGETGGDAVSMSMNLGQICLVILDTHRRSDGRTKRKIKK